MTRAGWLSLSLVAAVLSGCGGTPSKSPSLFPPRPEGCEVHLFHDSPDAPTTNIGPVRARCGLDVADADCVRTLEDQVCKLGGDIVWGVSDKPQVEGDKNYWQGRAAHSGSAPPR